MSGIAESSSLPPSVTSVVAESSQSAPPSSSTTSLQGSPSTSPREPGNPGGRNDDSHNNSEAVRSGVPDEALLDSASDASPQPLSRGKRLNYRNFENILRRSTSQKRLHPPTRGDGCCFDPSRVIPTELLFRCTSYLDSQSLLQLQLASKFYLDLARQNEAGWADLCQNLWRDKAAIAFSNDASNELPRYEPPDNWMHAYFSSISDAKRSFMTLDDLVFDPPDDSFIAGTRLGRLQNHDTTTPATLLSRLCRANNVWSFRFKESAGSDWTAQDPWYAGEPCRKLAFMRDGSILQYISVPPADASRKEAPSGFGRLSIGSPSTTDSSGCPDVSTSFELVDPPFPMRWRFLSNHPIDLPNRPFGSYVRMTVGGRDVPTYSVFRCEANWGFAMESCWGLYANFELPPRRQPQDALAGLQQEAAAESSRLQQQIRQRRRLRRTEDGGALWVVVDDDDDGNERQAMSHESGDDAGQYSNHPSFLRLRDDASLFITNEVQWREAFLYNVGALVLPEGDEAMSHFDRAWQGVT